MNRQRKLAIAGITGAMLVGAGTGMVLNLPTSAGATKASTAVVEPPADTTDDTTDTTSDTTDDTTTPEARRGGVLQDSLDELVADGTITQAQADAIIAGIEANRPVDGMGPMGGPGMGRGPGMGQGGMGHGPGMGRRGVHLETAATAIGITADELRTELQAGKTIADVATANGVDVQTVIDALVAEETANIVERVTDRVNGVVPERPADAPADDSTATTDSGAESSTTTD